MVVEGERVAILSLNCDRYYEAVFAIPWAGLCVVPLNTRWALLENDYALRDSGTRVLLFDDTFAEQAAQLMRDVDSLQKAIFMGDGECPDWADSYEQLIAANKPIAPSGRSGDDMVGIFYTGVDSDWFKAFLGAMLLLAVGFNRGVRRRATEARR